MEEQFRLDPLEDYIIGTLTDPDGNEHQGMWLRLQDVQRYVQSLRETHKFAESLSQTVIDGLKERCFELYYEAHPELVQVEQAKDTWTHPLA